MVGFLEPNPSSSPHRSGAAGYGGGLPSYGVATRRPQDVMWDGRGHGAAGKVARYNYHHQPQQQQQQQQHGLSPQRAWATSPWNSPARGGQQRTVNERRAAGGGASYWESTSVSPSPVNPFLGTAGGGALSPYVAPSSKQQSLAYGQTAAAADTENAWGGARRQHGSGGGGPARGGGLVDSPPSRQNTAAGGGGWRKPQPPQIEAPYVSPPQGQAYAAGGRYSGGGEAPWDFTGTKGWHFDAQRVSSNAAAAPAWGKPKQQQQRHASDDSFLMGDDDGRRPQQHPDSDDDGGGGAPVSRRLGGGGSSWAAAAAQTLTAQQHRATRQGGAWAAGVSPSPQQQAPNSNRGLFAPSPDQQNHRHRQPHQNDVDPLLARGSLGWGADEPPRRGYDDDRIQQQVRYRGAGYNAQQPPSSAWSRWGVGGGDEGRASLSLEELRTAARADAARSGKAPLPMHETRGGRGRHQQRSDRHQPRGYGTDDAVQKPPPLMIPLAVAFALLFLIALLR